MRNLYEFKMDSLYIPFYYPLRAYDKISLKDSVFNFWPTATIIVNDEGGKLTDKYFFIEGLKFDLTLGSKEGGYINNSYVWNDTSLEAMQMTEFVSGTAVLSLIHYLYNQDREKTGAFSSSVSDAVKNIMQEDFGLSLLDLTHVSTTTGKRVHYQMGKTNEDLIKNLCNCAYSQSYDTSPFLTFFNTLGEFYFMPIAEMFNQIPVGSYRFSTEAVKEADAVKGASIVCYGLNASKELYKQKIFKIGKDGISVNELLEIKDYYNPIDKKHKLLISKDNISSDVSQTLNIGYIEEETEADFYSGVVNNVYTLLNLSYQMKIMVDYNPAAVSGKIVNLDVEAASTDKAKGTEFSGKWLVIESEQYLDRNEIAMTQLTIAKSAIPVDPSHPLYSDYITA